MSIKVEKIPKCPKCDSSHVTRGGFQSGKRRWKCKDCKRRFQIGTLKRKPKPERKRKKKIEIVKTVMKQDATSIIDVPCFGCFNNPCEPETCLKLDEWLMNKNE